MDDSAMHLELSDFSGYQMMVTTSMKYSQRLTVGKLYMYCPKDVCPRFSLYKGPNRVSSFIGNIQSQQLFMVLERQERWILITTSSMIDGWMNLPNKLLDDESIFIEIQNYSAYEDFPGKQRFYSGGILMIGPDIDYLGGTIAVLLVSAILVNLCITDRIPYSMVLNVSAFSK
jgi:hypothetical protein